MLSTYCADVTRKVPLADDTDPDTPPAGATGANGAGQEFPLSDTDRERDGVTDRDVETLWVGEGEVAVADNVNATVNNEFVTTEPSVCHRKVTAPLTVNDSCDRVGPVSRSICEPVVVTPW
jgi:hypothetical protein